MYNLNLILSKPDETVTRLFWKKLSEQHWDWLYPFIKSIMYTEGVTDRFRTKEMLQVWNVLIILKVLVDTRLCN